MLNEDIFINFKNLIKGFLIISIVAGMLWFLFFKPLTTEKPVFPPIIMFNDTLYFTSGRPFEGKVPNGFEEVGMIFSSSSDAKAPVKNFQCNYDFAERGIIFSNSKVNNTIYVKYAENSTAKGIQAWKTEEEIQKYFDELNKSNKGGN